MDWLDYLTIFIVVFAGWFGWLLYIAPTPANEPEAHKFDDQRVADVLDSQRDELDYMRKDGML